MRQQKILALILAGGTGGRLGLLTDHRAKPVVPFAGFYRLIDFALSNCLHSKISDVWIVEQYELHSLNEHLSNGRPWDLDRTYGGLKILPPFEQSAEKADDKSGFAEGNADAIFRQLEQIEEFKPDILIVLSSDHVYKMDFREALETHLDKKAALTIVTTKLPKGENASRFGVIKANKDGRITDFVYKPKNPESDTITTEIFVYDAPVLIKTLKSLKQKHETLRDYGDELIPHYVSQKQVFEHRLEGYWRDVGTIRAFWESQMDFLDGHRKFVFDDENWQIRTLVPQLVPAFFYASANVQNSLIAHGARIYGKVSHSVLGSGVTVEKGAEITDSIILPHATVEKNVKLKKVIVDAGTNVNAKKVKEIERMQKEERGAIIIIGKRKIQNSNQLEE